MIYTTEKLQSMIDRDGRLDLDNTKITAEQITAFKAQVPNCIVFN